MMTRAVAPRPRGREHGTPPGQRPVRAGGRSAKLDTSSNDRNTNDRNGAGPAPAFEAFRHWELQFVSASGSASSPGGPPARARRDFGFRYSGLNVAAEPSRLLTCEGSTLRLWSSILVGHRVGRCGGVLELIAYDHAVPEGDHPGSVGDNERIVG